MNLILSQDSDISTGGVCEWFYAGNIEFQRINVDSIGLDQIDYNKITAEKLSSYLKPYYSLENGYNYSLSNNNSTDIFGFLGSYHSIWYRRPNMNLKNIQVWLDENSAQSQPLTEKIKINKKNELKNLYEFILSEIICEKQLGGLDNSMNKLKVLALAKKVGIVIPETMIVSNKTVLENFKDRFENGIITKSIYEAIHCIDDNGGNIHLSYTLKLEDTHLERVPDSFSPSLIQENLDKEYEIRAFYINKDFYAMAIFSQNNQKTKTDFREYDYKNPNRTVPFKLPAALKNKLTRLMGLLDLNCGSIDLVKTKNGDIVFLEINPVGQFGMVSAPCNYNLEFQIFKHLTNESN